MELWQPRSFTGVLLLWPIAGNAREDASTNALAVVCFFLHLLFYIRSYSSQKQYRGNVKRLFLGDSPDSWDVYSFGANQAAMEEKEKANRKVIFLITGLAYGGAETQLVQLARGIKTRGWVVRVVSMLPPRAYVADLEELGIPVETLGMRRGVPDPRALLRLARILRRERPQVLHSHMVHANLLARLVRPLAWVPALVCTAHSIDEGGRHREWAYRFTDFLCDLTTQVSQIGAERYIQVGAVPRTKLQVVPNGVDTKRFSPRPTVRRRLREELDLKNFFVWLAVGRFEEPKDYPTMIHAFAKVHQHKDRIPTQLLIAGQGPMREAIEKLALELGIASAVRFLGLRRDIPDLMNAADAYVLSSAWEGLPMVLLEASASGLPVVATDVGGNSEAVLHEKTGLLVPPKNSEALASAMIRLMTFTNEQRKVLGEAGRAHIEARFKLEVVIEQWESLYDRLLMLRRLSGEHT
jgi:glycosyltransferase involved in cell wall biosynthesis